MSTSSSTLDEKKSAPPVKKKLIRGNRIGGGRKKDVYRCRGIDNKVFIERNDVITSGNGGQRRKVIYAVGAASILTSRNIFTLFNCNSIPNHFCHQTSESYNLSPFQFIAMSLTMIPIKVRVYRDLLDKTVKVQFFLKNKGGHEQLLVFNQRTNLWEFDSIDEIAEAQFIKTTSPAKMMPDTCVNNRFFKEAVPTAESAFNVLADAFSQTKWDVELQDLRFQFGWEGEMFSKDGARRFLSPTLSIGGIIDADSICLSKKGHPEWVMSRRTLDDYTRVATITSGFADIVRSPV